MYFVIKQKSTPYLFVCFGFGFFALDLSFVLSCLYDSLLCVCHKLNGLKVGIVNSYFSFMFTVLVLHNIL